MISAATISRPIQNVLGNLPADAEMESFAPPASLPTGFSDRKNVLAFSLRCGSRGLRFRPIERTHLEKEVMSEETPGLLNRRDAVQILASLRY